MDEFIDYYKILEVDKKSSHIEIRQKYLLLAFKYHPDKNIHLSNEVRIEYENKFKMINNAFSILSDPIERKNYDKLLESKKGKNRVFYSYHNEDCNFTISSIILKMVNKVFSEEQLQNGKEFLNVFNKFLNINNYNYDNIPEILTNYKSFFEKKNIERQNKLHNNSSEFSEKKDKNNKKYNESTESTENMENMESMENKDNNDNNDNNSFENTENNQVSNIMKKNKYDIKKNTSKQVNDINTVNEDIIYNIYVSLADIYNGIIKQLDIQRNIFCNHCLGKGYLGYGIHMSLCHLCKGIMKTIETKFFPIDIREQKIILRNEGNQIDENIFSDVIINIHSKPNDIFKRHNNYDLMYEQEVSIIDFYNEISINITHLDNRKYIIKYNSKLINNHEKENNATEYSLLNKRILRIRDLGLPIGTSGRRGDLYIKLNIYLPKLSNEQIKLLQNLSFMQKPKEKEPNEKEENNIIEIYAIL